MEKPFGAIEVKTEIGRDEVRRIYEAAKTGSLNPDDVLSRLFVTIAFLQATKLPSFESMTSEQIKDLMQELIIAGSRSMVKVLSDRYLQEIQVQGNA